MKKKFTFYAKAMTYLLLIILTLFLNSITQKTFAQITCTNETVLFLETFGTGTTPVSSTDAASNLVYQDTGSLVGEGRYRIINSTHQKPEWQNSPDHTGNADGRMMVINATSGAIYNHEIDRTQGFDAGSYTVTTYLMNVDTLGICGPNALLPNLSLTVEYLDATNAWVPLTGSPYISASVAQTAPSSPTWVLIGSSFTLPATNSFVVKSIRVILTDVTSGGCGNDFAMDDFKFSECPQGGPLPVTFLSINARQKGSGISVEWSTSQEINSSSFDVEKSANGNSNWSLVASVAAAGNSAVVKNYNAYDATPYNGNNFYRIKQIDKDGNFTYSKTVSISVSFAKTAVSVLTNPFHSSLTIDFSSAAAQSVSARLLDITGKQVVLEKWSIGAGSTRKILSSISSLQQGMYILNISNDKGEVIYNNKVMKQ